MYEHVNLNVKIDLGEGASISGKASIPLEEVVEEIANGLYDHPNITGNYDERTEYALKEIALNAINILKNRPFGEKEHKEQIKIYQELVYYLDHKK